MNYMPDTVFRDSFVQRKHVRRETMTDLPQRNLISEIDDLPKTVNSQKETWLSIILVCFVYTIGDCFEYLRFYY